ncbi:MAG: hypothetical protein MI922_17760 [Bacteroidales bacterium]|nr:hypothetical protein [Bacteroidales bacterium]
MELTSFKSLFEFAKEKAPMRVAVVGANEETVIEATLKASRKRLILPVFIGDKNKVPEQYSHILNEFEYIDIADTAKAAEYAVDLWLNNQTDLLMKGLISTSELLHYVLKKRNEIMDNNLLSHFALFNSDHYHKCFGVTDVAINIAPNVLNRISIIRNSIKAFNSLHIQKPKVALLSAVEKVSTKIDSTVESQEIQKVIQVTPDIDCDISGPLSFDLAISSEAARIKQFNGGVAGNADLLVVPELISGNILYKSLTYMAKAKCASVVLGAKAPIILTSRADELKSKYYSIVLGVALTDIKDTLN